MKKFKVQIILCVIMMAFAIGFQHLVAKTPENSPQGKALNNMLNTAPRKSVSRQDVEAVWAEVARREAAMKQR